MSALTDEQLSAIWIDDRTNNEKHDCVSYARAVIAADRALRGQPVAWIDKHELAMIPLWPDEPTVSAQPVSEYDVPLYASPTIPEGYVLVPIEPTENQWGFLARDIILWMEMDRPTPEKLFKHLKMLGREIPNWLINEHEMKNMGTVPSKGTRAVLIYKAMIEAAKEVQS